MKAFWDQRYGNPEYVYGTKPNTFFSAQLENAMPGKLLLPGEGEGRNAVYAATRAWEVDAFDQSTSGYEKALALASEKGVEIHYRVCRLKDFPFEDDHYDCAGLLYFHLESPMREYLHRKIFDSLVPGGMLILEAFHKEQIDRETGGPKSLDMLYNEEILDSDFVSFDTILLEKQEIRLNEGVFHQGEASVIRYIGKKPQQYVR